MFLKRYLAIFLFLFLSISANASVTLYDFWINTQAPHTYTKGEYHNFDAQFKVKNNGSTVTIKTIEVTLYKNGNWNRFCWEKTVNKTLYRNEIYSTGMEYCTLNETGDFEVVAKVQYSDGSYYDSTTKYNISVRDAPKPSTPTLVSPNNNANVDGTTQTLDWGNVSGATGYELALRDVTLNRWIYGGSKPVKSTSSSQATVSGLTEGHKYAWTVQAKNNAGLSNDSSARYFTVNVSATIINGECGTANSHTFLANESSWNGYDQCAVGITDNTTFPNQGETIGWNCLGSNGGSNDYCEANRETALSNTALITDVTPLTATQNIAQTYIITGTHLSPTMVGNIEGSSSYCSVISTTSMSIEMQCTAEAIGDKRFYLKDKKGGTSISGSENIYIKVSKDTSLNPTGLPSNIDAPVNGTGWRYNQHGGTFYDGIGSTNDNKAWDINWGNSYDDDGLPVYAVESGTVQTFDGWGGKSYGQLLIRHGSSGHYWYSGYLHMKNITTKTTISKGDKIGEISRTGYLVNSAITSPHLHFAVYEKVNNKLLSRNITINKNKLWEDNGNPINGQCGTANNHTFSATDTNYSGYPQCSQGTSDNTSFPNQGSSVSWNCVGLNEGSSASCNASRNDGNSIVHDPTVSLVSNLPVCKSSEHKNKGYACIKTGTELRLTFKSDDVDGDLSSLDVDIDGSGSPEYSKGLYGSSDTVSFTHTFSDDMFDKNKCELYKNKCLKQMFTMTATAYDSRGVFTEVGTKAKYLLYSLAVHNEQQRDIAIVEEEKRREEAEAEKLRLEADKVNKEQIQNNIKTDLQSKENEYLESFSTDLNTRGEIPTGTINNDCPWREDSQCKNVWVDTESRVYGFKKKSENYKEYPYTLYVSYNFNRKYDMGAGLFPAEIWVKYHAPKGIIDTFNHDVDHPRSSPKILVMNSKMLEAESEVLIEMVKESIDKNMELDTKLFLKIRRKMINSTVASAEEIQRYIFEMREAALNTKFEMNLTEKEYLMAISLTVDSIPIISTSKSLSQLWVGQDIITADVVSRPWEAVDIILSIWPPAKVSRKAKKYGVAVDRAKLIIKTIIKNRKIGKQAEKLLKAHSRLTKEFTTLSSKVGENPDISYVATIIVNGEKVKKRRYFDLFDSKTKTGIESKVGNPKLTDFTKIQIKKDIASLQRGHTKKIIWISHKNKKGDVGFDDEFMKYVKKSLEDKGFDFSKIKMSDIFEFRGKNFKPPYLNTNDIYKGID